MRCAAPRRPQRPRASRPIWGSILLILGVALTIGSAFAILTIEVTDLPWDSPLRAIPPFGIVIGPILVQIGILLSGRWLLWITAKALSPVSVAARIAARDAAANSSRTVPAFAAIAATVFVAVFAMSQTSMQNAWTARDWAYQAPVGTLAIAIQPTGEESTVDSSVASEATDAGIALADSVGASGTAVIARQPEVWGYANSLDIPADETRVIAVMPDRHLFDPEVENSFTANGQNRPNPIAVLSVDELDEALGVTVSFRTARRLPRRRRDRHRPAGTSPTARSTSAPGAPGMSTTGRHPTTSGPLGETHRHAASRSGSGRSTPSHSNSPTRPSPWPSPPRQRRSSTWRRVPPW